MRAHTHTGCGPGWAVGVARSLAIVKIAAIIHVLPATEITTTTAAAQSRASASSFNWSKCSKCKLRNDLHFDWHILGELFAVFKAPPILHSSLSLSLSLLPFNPCSAYASPPFTCCPMSRHIGRNSKIFPSSSTIPKLMSMMCVCVERSPAWVL